MQGKYWCFTLNNPTLYSEQVGQAFTERDDHKYLIFQHERGENGTNHFQGYAEFTKLRRLTQVRKILPSAHWERRKGTQQQAIDYCKKTDTRIEGPWQFGSPAENNQGARTDLQRIASMCVEGSSLYEVAHSDPEAYIKYHRGINALITLTRKPKVPPNVVLLFGPSGVGKSRAFTEDFPENDRWMAPLTDGFWFDGYYGQQHACLDDFAGAASKFSLTQFLRLIDRYDVQVPIKGGFTQWVPQDIYVTTNIHPKYWWDYSKRSEQYHALKRRFHKVIWWQSFVDKVTVVPTEDDWDYFWTGPLVNETVYEW